MAKSTYADRLRNDYRKTFKPAHGKNVLMDLYEHLYGYKPTMPPDGNATWLAYNEGKRWAWLRIMEFLKEGDQDMRRLLEEQMAERNREAQANL